MQTTAVKAHSDELASVYDAWKRKNAYYYSTLKTFFACVVQPQASVFDT